MGSINYKELYKLQDKVLDAVFEAEDIFYLTGGTCLSRFYQAKRYSDDLDFFADAEPRFKLGIKNIKHKLDRQFDVHEEIASRDFVRWVIDGKLQVDFINDRVYRLGESVMLDNGYRIDNIPNILSNKLNALIDRDEPKDIFDIYLISKYYSFDWDDILDAAHKKTNFAHEDLVVRLKTFPKELMKEISLIDTSFLDEFDSEFPVIIEEINEMSEHKLAP